MGKNSRVLAAWRNIQMMLATAILVLCAGQARACQTYLVRLPAPVFVAGQAVTVELPPVSPSVSWTEAVPSWNLDHSEPAELTVEARVIYPDHTTQYYSFGTWSGLRLIGTRRSAKGQKDADGQVLTDTLRMAQPGGKLQFRLTGRVLGPGALPKLTRLFVNFCDARTFAGGTPASRDAGGTPALQGWGLVIDPPRLAQGNYPGGKGLCSPTSVAMVLNYWAARMGQKSLAVTVPEVQSSVFDPVYGGTGNWAFNVAYAGSRPGLLAYAARLDSISDLESWIERGVPVICSVSWYLLHGELLKDDEEGHLVVLIGFTPHGDPVFNDPGDRAEVRKVYKRADFEAAWAYSKHTVYIICPSKFVGNDDVEGF